MATYRLYCLDGAGHISLAEWIEADSDADAVASARRMKADAHRCEIWLGRQLIAQLDAEDLARPAP
jgi:hypothetical protein